MRLIALQFVPPSHDEELTKVLNNAAFVRGGAPWRWFVPLATLQTTVAPRERVSHFSDMIGTRVITRLHERNLDKVPHGHLQVPRYNSEKRAICELSLNTAPLGVLRGLLGEKLREEFTTDSKYRMLPLPTDPIPLHLTFRGAVEEGIFMGDREQDKETVPLLLQGLGEAPLEAIIHLIPTTALV